MQYEQNLRISWIETIIIINGGNSLLEHSDMIVIGGDGGDGSGSNRLGMFISWVERDYLNDDKSAARGWSWQWWWWITFDLSLFCQICLISKISQIPT